MDDAALANWLALREQADWSARSADLTRAIADRMAAHDPVCVLDLGTGAGSNLRYLAGHLPPRQRWLAVDRSEALLSELLLQTSVWSAAQEDDGLETPDREIEMRVHDLSALDPALFDGQHLVTASALLDLVSAGWLERLAGECRRVRAAALFAITYDGRSTCDPQENEDELVRGLMNAHQQRDKGLGGPAEGPRAAATAERAFVGHGFRVVSAASDWVLGPERAAMQRVLIDGWAEAAVAVAPHVRDTIASWHVRRLEHVNAGRSHIVVGHRDVAAWME